MFGRSSITGAVLAAVAFAFVVAADAGAQGLDDSLVARIRAELATGDRVGIGNADGSFSSGVLIGVSKDSLRLRTGKGVSEIALQEVTEVRKRRDSPWDGFLIGGALGAAIGFGTYTDCEPVPPCRTCEGNLTTSRGMETVVGAALFAAVGMTADLLMDQSPTVYRASAPRRGISVTASPARVQAGYRIAF